MCFHSRSIIIQLWLIYLFRKSRVVCARDCFWGFPSWRAHAAIVADSRPSSELRERSNQNIRCQIQQTLCRLNTEENKPLIPLAGVAATVLHSLAHHLKADSAFRRALYFWIKGGPILFHYKFTHWWLTKVRKGVCKERRNVIYGRLHDRYCNPSLKIILKLQGLFAKIGQVCSSRPDFVPHQYVELFSLLQDSIPQWPYKRVKKLVKQSLRKYYGLAWEDVFESMNPIALGCASIGQVHEATLRKQYYYDQTSKADGRKVAVKVMHPDAKKRFENDFSIFRWVCRLVMPGWKPILKELKKQMMTEFNYQDEALNLAEVRENMMASPYANRVVVPQPLLYLCTPNLLVMELLKGKKFTDAIEERLAKALGSDTEAAKEFIRQKRNDLILGKQNDKNTTSTTKSGNDWISLGSSILKQASSNKSTSAHDAPTSFVNNIATRVTLAARLISLYRYYKRSVDLLVDVHGHQIFLDLIFNGDCHPGNIMEIEGGEKLGLIDYGQTKRLSMEESLGIAKVVFELGRPNCNVSEVADGMRQLGFRTKYNNDQILYRYAKLFFDSDDESKAEGYETPQLYLVKLNKMDPLTRVPDAAVFCARTSFMFRGMGAIIGTPIRTSNYWKKHAKQLLLSQKTKEGEWNSTCVVQNVK